jgi:transposase
MNVHKNARLTPHSRAELVRRVVTEGQVPTAFGVDVKTVRKWVARYLGEGPEGLKDRSSRPHRLRKPTPKEIVEKVEMTFTKPSADSSMSPARGHANICC